MKRKIKVGIIGCGTIGREVARACQARLNRRIDLIGICDSDAEKAKALQKVLKGKVQILDSVAIIKKSGLIVEAASAHVSCDIVKKCIRYKKDVLVMSVGGLLGKRGLLSTIRRSPSTVYLPSGALCGLDGIKAASIGGIRSARITTRKPPRSLEGAPYITQNKIDVKAIDKETVIFEGTAREAIAAFPQNINVAAVLSLASVGEDETKVRIITSPEYTKNVHEVEVEGDFGKITTRTENVPSERNPKTSWLAILSAIATLERIVDNVRIGT